MGLAGDWTEDADAGTATFGDATVGIPTEGSVPLREFDRFTGLLGLGNPVESRCSALLRFPRSSSIFERAEAVLVPFAPWLAMGALMALVSSLSTFSRLARRLSRSWSMRGSPMFLDYGDCQSKDVEISNKYQFAGLVNRATTCQARGDRCCTPENKKKKSKQKQTCTSPPPPLPRVPLTRSLSTSHNFPYRYVDKGSHNSRGGCESNCA
jgi:hypothetical protein